MTSIGSIVRVVPNGKENYQEWFRNLKSSLVFNDLWEVCQGKNDSDGKEISPQSPDNEKQHAIWETKDKKSYALKNASVTEEVSRYIISYGTTFEALNKLK